MRDFEAKTIQNLDILINYYNDVDVNKATTYTRIKKSYYEKINAFEVLPEDEVEWVKNIENAVLSEMGFIREVKRND